MQQTNWGLYYRLLTFARSRASYSQTCSDAKRCGTPAQRKPERPVFQPRDRGEVFWNTALLSIEQSSLLLLHEYEYKVADITMNYVGTATLRHPQLLYVSSRTTRSSGTTTGSETTNDDDGLQSTRTLAGTLILAREHRNNTKQASNPGMTCKLA